MLLQEVGFDVVSMWKEMGFLPRALILVVGLASAYLLGVVIRKFIGR